MPDTSSTPPPPPILAPESTSAWRRLCLLLRVSTGRVLLVARHDSPRLPRELPAILAAQSGRPLLQVVVSDTQPDPFAKTHDLDDAPPKHDMETPNPGPLLSITGAENLGLGADAARETEALYEFARRLDFRRDQFLPEGGVVLVWATERVFEALIQHSPNFLSLATTLFTFHATNREDLPSIVNVASASATRALLESSSKLPPLPEPAPREMASAYEGLSWLALAEQQYRRGGEDVIRGITTFDEHRDQIEASWDWAAQTAGIRDQAESRDVFGIPRLADAREHPSNDPLRIALILLAEYPITGARCLAIRQTPVERIKRAEVQVAAARALGDKAMEGSALGNLGNGWHSVGELDRAIELHRMQLAIAQELGDVRGENAGLGNLANLLVDKGDPMEAVRLHELALSHSRITGVGELIAEDLTNLGIALVAFGSLEKAQACYEEALQVARQIGNRHLESQIIGNLAALIGDRGDSAKAIALRRQELEIVTELKDRAGQARSLYNLAVELEQSGNDAEARRSLEEAIRIAGGTHPRVAKSVVTLLAKINAKAARLTPIKATPSRRR